MPLNLERWVTSDGRPSVPCTSIRQAYTRAMDPRLVQVAAATGFEWDAGNAAKNWTRHTVTQAECEQVFFNVRLLVAADAAHSNAEARSFTLGRTDAGRRLLVVSALRGSQVRVISARPMSRREREVYARAEAQDE